MGDILFLAHRVPFPPNRGDKIRAHHLLRKLATIAPVHVGCFAESDEDRRGEAELSRIAKTHCIADRTKPLVLAGAQAVVSGLPVSLTAFCSAKLHKWARETLASQDISAIVVFSGQMGQYIPADFKGRVIVDLCDVDSAKFESYANSGERAWLNRRESRLLAREEERLAHRADATTLITSEEAGLFRDRLKAPAKANLQVIGNGIDASFFDPTGCRPHPDISRRSGPHFVFTGQMDYRPNEQAALWAIKNFLPSVRQAYVDADLHIVGRNPTTALRKHNGENGVYVWGEVPDVRPFIAASTCVIAPLLIARGVQNKVLEAMAMEKPVLLTPEAATGISAVDGEHWAVADTHSMADRALALTKDPNLRSRKGKAARRFVLENHDWDSMLKPIEDLLGYASEGARDAA